MNKTTMLAGVGAFLLLTAFSCGGSNKSRTAQKEEETKVAVPSFDADSAYLYIKKQVDFGPRVPNTPGHVECGDFLARQLERFGARVVSQQVDLIAYDGTLLKARNIVGSYRPESKKRIALFAHWDTRPWADNDSDKKNHRTPVLGANDGASGVGVLLEVARQIGIRHPALGVDIIFLDAEDYGAPQFYEGRHTEESWCLGAQHWARNPHVEGYNARFGILLDMVGDKNSVFAKESYSEEFAADINRKVWQAAQRLGYGHLFVEGRNAGYVTDDHVFINRIARIKTVDVIASAPEGDFVPTWHTVDDTMEHIDKTVLKAVGQTVLEVVYNEK